MLPFFALKGLSFLPFGGLLKNPKLLIGIIMVAVVVFGVWKWKTSIREAAYAAIYTEQAEQHIENQRKEMQRTQELFTESQRAVRLAQDKRAQLLKSTEQARARTRNVKPSNDGEVAPVLAEALDFIRNSDKAPVVARTPTLGDTVNTQVDKAKAALAAAQEATTDVVTSSGNSFIDAWNRLRGKK
jgi:hypothetical protein